MKTALGIIILLAAVSASIGSLYAIGLLTETLLPTLTDTLKGPNPTALDTFGMGLVALLGFGTALLVYLGGKQIGEHL